MNDTMEVRGSTGRRLFLAVFLVPAIVLFLAGGIYALRLTPPGTGGTLLAFVVVLFLTAFFLSVVSASVTLTPTTLTYTTLLRRKTILLSRITETKVLSRQGSYRLRTKAGRDFLLLSDNSFAKDQFISIKQYLDCNGPDALRQYDGLEQTARKIKVPVLLRIANGAARPLSCCP